MAIFSVGISISQEYGRAGLWGDEWRFVETVILESKPNHERKRLDKLTSQAKIPPISGKLI